MAASTPATWPISSGAGMTVGEFSSPLLKGPQGKLGRDWRDRRGGSKAARSYGGRVSEQHRRDVGCVV